MIETDPMEPRVSKEIREPKDPSKQPKPNEPAGLKVSRSEYLNIPNALTGVRIALIFVFLYLYLTGRYMPAVVVFVVAAITDMLDGYAARRLNQITKLGKILDPVADKLMIVSALTALFTRNWCPMWLLLIIAAKEFLMLIGGLVMLRRGIVIQAIFIGKVTTVMFIAAIILTFFHELTAPFDLYLQIAVCVLSVFAMFVYARKAFIVLKEVPKESPVR